MTTSYVLRFFHSFRPTELRSPIAFENKFRSMRSPSTWLVTPRTTARSKTKNSVLPFCLPSILPGVLWTKSRPTRRSSIFTRRTSWSATNEPTDANEDSPAAVAAIKSYSLTGSHFGRSAPLPLDSPNPRRKPSSPLLLRDVRLPSQPKRQTPRLPSSSKRRASHMVHRPRCRPRCFPPLLNHISCRA